jgi:folylpolyglutamate synthase/dihydrofolate synthase
MGGTLDATNILENQVVSVISKIAYDHQKFLGNSLQEIARHKAGILRPKVPFIVNPVNEWNVHNVVDRVAEEIGAGPRLYGEQEHLRKHIFGQAEWKKATGAMLPTQCDNAALAVLAVKEALGIKDENARKMQKLIKCLRTKQIAGRYQTVKSQAIFGGFGPSILLDGAHNEDAAQTLSKYVSRHRRWAKIKSREGSFMQPPRRGWPITWVIAMTEGRNIHDFLVHLLTADDRIVTTTFGPVDGMPWVKPVDPNEILRAAKSIFPTISGISMREPETHQALLAAKYLGAKDSHIVLTGSLYLVGQYMREKNLLEGPDSENMPIHLWDREQRYRVNKYLTGDVFEGEIQGESAATRERERQTLEEEIARLDAELAQLENGSASLEQPQTIRYHQSAHYHADLGEIRHRILSPPATSRDQAISELYKDLRQTSPQAQREASEEDRFAEQSIRTERVRSDIAPEDKAPYLIEHFTRLNTSPKVDHDDARLRERRIEDQGINGEGFKIRHVDQPRGPRITKHLTHSRIRYD